MFNSRRLLEVLDDAVLDTPLQKVELCTRRRKPLEINALCSAKWVEQFLAVPIQTRLVCNVDRKHLPGWRRVRHVVRLGVVCHEPLEFAKGYTLAVAQNIVKLLSILWNIKKFRETAQKNLRLAHCFLELSNL
jgi:hypothetical protein